MSLFEEIRAAVHVQRRRLHNTYHPDKFDPAKMAPSFKADQVEEMLRVEIDRDCQDRILSRADWEVRDLWLGGPKGRPSPLKVDGISWYVLDQLPAPGWRVINPMEPPRG